MCKCYLCDKELIEKKYYEENKKNFNEKPAINHKEHIIQNGLHGKLKVEDILCSDCGGILSTEIDTQFCSLFDLITVQLKDILVKKDHGKNNKPKTLKGYLYKDNSLKDKIDINYKDRSASPETPYYEFNSESQQLKIFANKVRAEHFKNIVLEKLSQDGIDTKNIGIEVISDIQSHGFLGLHFTEGVKDFNTKFGKGFSKIAIGFALSKGIKREELDDALKIKEDGTSEIISSNNLIPFFPLGPFDRFNEENRLITEAHYPSHKLILFSQKYSDNSKKLFCYISLFSTFQYYVRLNDQYLGSDIYETYYQTVLKQEVTDIDIKKTRPKDLSLIVNEFGIDTSKYEGQSITDYIDFIEREFKKITLSSQLDLSDTLTKSASILTTSYALSQAKQQMPYMPNKTVIESFKNIIEGQRLALLMELNTINNNDFSLYKTKFLEDDGKGQLEALSYPDELILAMKKNESIFKHYGRMKFDQLTDFTEQNKNKTA
jgi:hypothetical protein